MVEVQRCNHTEGAIRRACFAIKEEGVCVTLLED